MLISILVIVLIGVVVYFHYLQGFFSAALSALFAVIASLVAISYHEVVVESLLGGKYADQAYAGAIVGLFGLTYVVLRAVFDKAVPGNIRIPFLVDKIGAPVMGLIAGIFTLGTLVIAAQTLPLGPSIAGYMRFPVQFDRAVRVKVSNKSQLQDAVFDEVDKKRFLADDADGLLIPVDDLVLKLAKYVSDESGSLFNGWPGNDAGRPLARIHPDYLQELYGQRIGLQIGSKHTAMPKRTDASGVYIARELPQRDQERMEAEGAGLGVRFKEVVQDEEKKLAPTRKPDAGRVLVIVRARFGIDDTDEKTSHFAFSPGSVRLVARVKDGDKFKYHNYFLIGTLENARTLFVNAPDDYLFAAGGKGADLVFEVDEDGLFGAGYDAKDPKTWKIAPGTFLEVKRMGRVDLAEKQIESGLPKADEQFQVVRKSGVGPAGSTADTGGGRNNSSGQATSPVNATLAIDGRDCRVANVIPTPINVGSASPDERRGEQDWGQFSLQGGKFSRLALDPIRTVQMMQQGPNKISEFFVPDGQRMVIVLARPAGQDKWAWASSLGDYQLVDAGDKKFAPNGGMARLKNSNAQDMLVVRYSATRAETAVPASTDMTPTDVVLMFLVPAGTELKAVTYKDQPMATVSLKAQ